jgi:hypothetical protein
MATALQFFALSFRKTLSCLAHFLRFFGRQNGRATKAFSALFSPQEGERHFTNVVHRVVHPRVRPCSSLTNLQTKCAHRALKCCVESLQPTRSRQHMVLEPELKCMGQCFCNPETTRA